MATITLRVLDGADRGRVFEGLGVPVTIGREEGNSIQLNDERISRFHLKIQQDHDDLVLTDLESTNGSKVNNEEVQLRILRHGDLITVGRSTLIFGNRAQIKERMERMGKSGKRDLSENGSQVSDEMLAVKDKWRDDPNYQLSLLEMDPPKLPERMSPGQAAQLSEVIEYLHMHIRGVVSDADVDTRRKQVALSIDDWQKIIDTQARLAEYLRNISFPS